MPRGSSGTAAGWGYLAGGMTARRTAVLDLVGLTQVMHELRRRLEGGEVDLLGAGRGSGRPAMWPGRRPPSAATCHGSCTPGDCTAVETLPKAGVFAEAMGVVSAKNIIADITGKVSSRYGGAGYCFLEFPDHRASALEGNSFAEAADLAMADPTAESYTR